MHSFNLLKQIIGICLLNKCHSTLDYYLPRTRFNEFVSESY